MDRRRRLAVRRQLERRPPLQRRHADGGQPEAGGGGSRCRGTCARPTARQVDYVEPAARTRPDDFCCRDLLDPNILNCDERRYVGSADADAQRRSGSATCASAASRPGWCGRSRRCPTDCDRGQRRVHRHLRRLPRADDDRLLIGVRGDTSLTYVDVQSSGADTPPVLKCVGAADGSAGAGRLRHVRRRSPRDRRQTSALASPSDDPRPPDVPLPDEPYALAIDTHDWPALRRSPERQHDAPVHGRLLAVRRLAGAAAGAEPPGRAAVHRAVLEPVRGQQRRIGRRHRAELRQTDGDASTRRRATRPRSPALGTTANCPRPARRGARDRGVPERRVLQLAARGRRDARDPVRERHSAFVLQRSPPALVAIPARDSQRTGTPTDILETCSSPTFLDKYDDRRGETRLFVTCFDDGEIYVFDPARAAAGEDVPGRPRAVRAGLRQHARPQRRLRRRLRRQQHLGHRPGAR